MRPAPWIYSALAAFALAGSAAGADELQMTTAPQSTAGHPARGMSMEKVEATFGAPTTRVPAVGGSNAHQPPITRWEYPGFTVYFENNVVVHSVIVG
ncbi:MAG TPA: hypothetical protein VGN07_01640 [Steroidobacteraceae bacterium]|jgi:hypothetical protein